MIKKDYFWKTMLCTAVVLLAVTVCLQLNRPQVVRAEEESVTTPVLVEVGSVGMADLDSVIPLGEDKVICKAGEYVFIYQVETRTLEGRDARKKQAVYQK